MVNKAVPQSTEWQAVRILAAVIWIFWSCLASGQLVPGFQEEVVTSGWARTVDLEVLPDGRMLLLRQVGRIIIFDPAQQPIQATTYLALADIESNQERGLASMTLDPDFLSNGYIYLYYTHGSSSRNRISRFTHLGDTADPGSEVLIWEDNEDWSSCCHYGGGLDFGPDGMLYLTTGEEFDGGQAQDLSRAGGKVIRINPDGSIPADNPFVDGPGGNLDEIWALGLRNPYRAYWDRIGNRFFISEVGGNVQSTAMEDLHLGRAGANYGWPSCEGPCADPAFDDPLYSYSHTEFAADSGAIVAGFIYHRTIPQSGLVAHYDADSGVAVTGGNVVTGWSDLSGQANDLTASGNPVLIPNALKGHAVVDFDGTGDKLERISGISGLPTGSADRTVFLVSNYRGTGYGGFAYGHGVGPPWSCNETFGLVVNPAGDLMVQGWCDDFASGRAGTGQGWLVQSAVVSSGELSHFLNGELIDSRTHTYNTVLDRIVLGAEMDSAPYVDMQVAEVLVYDRALNVGELELVQNHLRQKYINASSAEYEMLPPSFDGAFFFSDYALSFIKYLTFNPDGSVASVNDFADDIGFPVGLVQGLDGAIYAVDYLGRVLRYKYNSGNQAPVITSSTVTPTSGAPPLDSTFSVTASDPENDVLTYHWFFGDGTDAFGQNVSHTYTALGVYDAYVEVSDGGIAVQSQTYQVDVGSPPTVTVDSPLDGSFFRANDTLVFSGTATDPDETIPANNYVWDVDFLHNGHSHPALAQFSGVSGQIVVPADGHDWHDNTAYRLSLTVTDSTGISTTATATAYPDKVDLNIESAPAGIPLFIDGLPQDAPYVYDTLIDFQHVLAAPDTHCLNGQLYSFDNWSDSGSATHQITAPSTVTTYTATYMATGSCASWPTNGLVTHLEADAGVLTTGSTILSWADQSTMANDLSASGNPQLVAAALNGNPVISFDGNGDKLERVLNLNGLPVGNADRSVYVVIDYQSNGPGGFAYGTNKCNQAFGLIVNRKKGRLMVQGWCDIFNSRDAGAGEGWMVQSVIHNGGQMTHYRDGSVIDTRSHAFNTVLNNMLVGAELDSNPYITMQVAAILVYNRALNATEDQQVLDYLNTKYFNISTVNLPPVAGDDSATVTDGFSVVIPVLSTDSDDGLLDPTSVFVTSGPQFGTTGVNVADGSITYTHDGSGAGTDSFSYIVSDSTGLPSNEATVNITINADQTIDLSSCGGADPAGCVVSFFDGVNLSNVYTWLADSGFSDPLQVISTANGLVRISGEKIGSLSTNDEYRNYVLVMEYKWGDETFSPRVTKAKNAGITIHSKGIEGGWNGKFMPGIQSQIIEGSNGDIILLKGNDADGNLLPLSVTSETTQVTCTFSTWNCRGGYVWQAGATPQVFDQVLDHIHWYGWDPDWRDVTGFRGQTVLESPDGEWNQMVVVANGGQMQNYLNGTLVNEARFLVPSDGKIQLESEYAEYFVRRWELWPLDLQPTPIRPTSITSDVLPDGISGVPYSTVIETIGDLSVVSWELDSGTVPPGLIPDWATGTLSGTPTVSGSFSFTVTATDDSGAKDTQLLSLFVSNSTGDLPPIAIDDGAIVVRGQFVNIAVLNNDTDDIGIDPTSVEIVSLPTQGIAIADAVNGEITYSHNGISLAGDSFTYRVADSIGQFSAPATVNVTVNEVNASVLVISPADNAIVTSNDVQIQYQLAGTDYDHLHLSLDNNAHVTITNLTGSFSFNSVPDGQHTVTATLVNASHQAMNGPDSEDSVTFTVDSVAGNQPPVASDDQLTIVNGASAVIPVLANDSDDSGLDPSTVLITTGPASGVTTLEPADGSITYFHDASGPGSDSFSYQVNDDGGLTSNEAIVSITINATGNSIPAPGLVLHLEADSGVTSSGGSVMLWADQSTMANDLTASGDPQLLANVLNGNPVIDFDGSGDKLERQLNLNGLSSGNGDRSVYLVANYRSKGYGGFAWGSANCNETFGLVVDGRGKLTVQGWCNDFKAAQVGTGQGWLVQSAILSSSQLVHYLNGIQIDGRSHAYNTVAQTMVVGAELDSIPFLNMQVAAIVVYNRALSAAEHDQVQAYLQSKYFGN